MLVETALRVLNCWVARVLPSPEDVQALRAAAPTPQSEWESDDLARYIVERELAQTGFRAAASCDDSPDPQRR